MTDRGRRTERVEPDRLGRRPLSATQVSTFKHCKRKWGWPYLDDIRGEPNAFAEFGIETHGHLEKWFTSGEFPPDTPTGKVAASGLHHWPAPSPDLEVEREFLYMRPSGPTRGFVDLASPTLLLVGDHKTTTDFRWAKTEEDLLNDPQAMLYAAQAMDRWNVSVIHLKWVYLRTRGATASKPVEVRVEWGYVDQWLRENWDPIAEEIHEIRRSGKRALDLAPNVNACQDYGGCAFKQLCGLSAKDRMRGRFAHMGLKEEMQARIAAQNAKAKGAAPAAAPPADPINPPEKAKAAPAKPIAKGEPITKTAVQKALPAPPPAQELVIDDGEAGTVDRAASHDFTLLVGCIPTKGTVINAQVLDVIAMAQRDLLKEFGVMDPRLVEYGKGPGLLATRVAELLDERPPSGFIYIDPSADLQRMVLEVYESRASLVIRRI